MPKDKHKSGGRDKKKKQVQSKYKPLDLIMPDDSTDSNSTRHTRPTHPTAAHPLSPSEPPKYTVSPPSTTSFLTVSSSTPAPVTTPTPALPSARPSITPVLDTSKRLVERQKRISPEEQKESLQEQKQRETKASSDQLRETLLERTRSTSTPTPAPDVLPSVPQPYPAPGPLGTPSVPIYPLPQSGPSSSQPFSVTTHSIHTPASRLSPRSSSSTSSPPVTSSSSSSLLSQTRPPKPATIIKPTGVNHATVMYTKYKEIPVGGSPKGIPTIGYQDFPQTFVAKGSAYYDPSKPQIIPAKHDGSKAGWPRLHSEIAAIQHSTGAIDPKTEGIKFGSPLSQGIAEAESKKTDLSKQLYTKIVMHNSDLPPCHWGNDPGTKCDDYLKSTIEKFNTDEEHHRRKFRLKVIPPRGQPWRSYPADESSDEGD